MASIQMVVIMAFCLITVRPYCVNVSSCFLKTLFDFSYPPENLWDISLSSTSSLNNIILGYGDFNNDLRADYVSLDPSNSSLLVYYYVNDGNQNGQYILQNVLQARFSCTPLNVYLYDADGNGQLDITVWGSYPNAANCLYLLLQFNGQFDLPNSMPYNASATTQPFLFEFLVNNNTKSTFLMFYDSKNAVRTIISWSLQKYSVIPWSSLFIDSATNPYSAIPFSSPHWNSFIDLTNDCYPEMVITNNNKNQRQIQFWVYQPTSLKYTLYNVINATNLTSMTFSDINYDGNQDILLSYSNFIQMYLGNLPTPSDFCATGTTISFNWAAPVVQLNSNCTLPQQNIQFGDLNIDGFPDLMFQCPPQSSPQILIFQNQLDSNNGFQVFNDYQLKINDLGISSNTAIRASFFDILENGIIDIMLTLNNASTKALYNNYLNQNSFYIKGYGTTGVSTNSYGTQVPGVTFYWINSLGNSQKLAVYSQLFQTAYGAMPMPYVVTGLGRANNYVQQFTIARLGGLKSWSPIIPNSQLAVFTGASTTKTWGIKIFIMPTDSIVYVVIVCIVILAILGIILVILKCRSRKEENVLLADYM